MKTSRDGSHWSWMGPRDPWFHYMPVRSWPLLSRRPSCVGIPHQTAKEPCTKVWLVWADFSPKAGLSYRVIYVSLDSIEKLVMGPIHQRLPKTELSHLPVMSPCRQFICQELELSVLLTPPPPPPLPQKSGVSCILVGTYRTLQSFWFLIIK